MTILPPWLFPVQKTWMSHSPCHSKQIHSKQIPSSRQGDLFMQRHWWHQLSWHSCFTICTVNIRSNKIEKIIIFSPSTRIEGLKKTVDFPCTHTQKHKRKSINAWYTSFSRGQLNIWLSTKYLWVGQIHQATYTFMDFKSWSQRRKMYGAKLWSFVKMSCRAKDLAYW